MGYERLNLNDGDVLEAEHIAHLEEGISSMAGKDGVGIASVVQTTSSLGGGGANVWTATLTDGTTSTFTVRNGNDGNPGKPGTSVTITGVSESFADGGSNVVMFSDGTTLTIKNGSKGSPGEGGSGGSGNCITWVTFTPDGDDAPLVADKTYAELSEAYAQGNALYAQIPELGIAAPLMMVIPDQGLVFEAIYPDDELTLVAILLMANDSAMVQMLPLGGSGSTPVRGVDYWTEADKAEIKSYVDDAILGGAW